MSKINDISENKKLSLSNYRQYYDKDYNHSIFLKETFGKFNYKGCDYVNPNGIKIEFKESFKQYTNVNKVRFAVYYKDYLDSDYIVFIHYNWQKNKLYCFLHNTKRILSKYKFRSNKAIAQPHLSTVRRNWLFGISGRKFLINKDIINNLKKLREFIDILEIVK